jgi:hypothetical protein
MNMGMNHEHGHAAWAWACSMAWACNMDMGMGHGHEHAEWTCTCSWGAIIEFTVLPTHRLPMVVTLAFSYKLILSGTVFESWCFYFEVGAGRKAV